MRKQWGKIKGPDNPTSQLLPVMSNTCCSGKGKEGKTKEEVKDRDVKKNVCEKLIKKKLCVCDKAVFERWCLTKKDGVCESCLCKRVCDKVVRERWCV